MQYLVRGNDGNEYGPVDLQTLKKWVAEGRIMPDSQVTDNLSNRTMLASELQELGMTPLRDINADTAAPPVNYADYPRLEDGRSTPRRRTRLWMILIWLGIAILLERLTNFSGIIIAGWNIYDAIVAKARKDPYTVWCFVVAISGFALVLFWTLN